MAYGQPPPPDPDEFDPAAEGIVTDDPGGGWRQPGMNPNMGLRAANPFAPGVSAEGTESFGGPVMAGSQGSQYGQDALAAAGVQGLVAAPGAIGAMAPAIPGLLRQGALGAGGAYAGGHVGKYLGGDTGESIGKVVGSLAGFAGAMPSHLLQGGPAGLRILRALLGTGEAATVAAPAEAALVTRLPAAIAAAKAAAQAEVGGAASAAPAISDAAAGVRNAWRIGSSTTQPLSEALASAKNPLLALRQLSLTMPREVVENEAKAAFGADAIRLLSLIY